MHTSISQYNHINNCTSTHRNKSTVASSTDCLSKKFFLQASQRSVLLCGHLTSLSHKCRWFPPFHRELNCTEATTLCQLQTHTPMAPYYTLCSIPPPVNSAPSPAHYTVWDGRARRIPGLHPNISPSYELWVAWMTSSVFSNQCDLVRTRAASGDLGFPD